jgi:hypothetical protein
VADPELAGGKCDQLYSGDLFGRFRLRRVEANVTTKGN